MLKLPRGESKLIPKLRNVRIRKTRDTFILQKPDIRKKLKINKDLFTILNLVDGTNSIEKVSKKLSVKYEQIENILFSLNQEGVLDLEKESSVAQPSICEYHFDFPLDMVYFEPTEKCNFKCMHCYASAPEKNDVSSELDNKGLENLVDQVDKMGILEICFTGGEPFISEKTLKLSKIFHERGIKLGYITNGSLINKKIVEELKRLRPSFIRMSFHSHEKRKFEEITGTKSYDLVLRNLMYLKEEGIVPAISCTLFNGLNDSYEGIKGFLNFFKKKDFKPTDITFDEFVPDGCGKDKNFYRINEKETVKKISNALKEVFKYESPKKESPLKDSYCGIGVSSLCIKSNGDLTLCPALSKPILGNFLERNIGDIWENSETFKYFRNKEYLKGTECENCDSLKNCFGGCKAKSLTFYKTMNAIDPWMCAHLK